MAKLDRQQTVNRDIKKGIARRVVLTCITDAAVMDFVDEGPFPVMNGEEVEGWQTKDPSGGRQRLLKQIYKRDAEGNPVWAHAHWVTENGKQRILPIEKMGYDRSIRGETYGVRLDGKTLTRIEVPEGIWHNVMQQVVPIPLADEAWLEAHAEHMSKRAEHAREGDQTFRVKAAQVEKEGAETAKRRPAKAGQTGGDFIAQTTAETIARVGTG